MSGSGTVPLTLTEATPGTTNSALFRSSRLAEETGMMPIAERDVVEGE
jgi:hypothetical protein